MERKRKRVLVLGGCVATVAVMVGAYALFLTSSVNDLGLTRSDLALGGEPDVEMLRERTKRVADAWLEQHRVELATACGGPYEIAVDYSLSRKTGSLGYRSSFYYYCWDIYLPYSLRTQSDKAFTVIVQMSDGVDQYQHAPDKFHVLRSMVIDDKGKLVEKTEETERSRGK